ncbi:hypothetical protein CVT25_006009 [Psilocybe cyanescens]|uniref:Uncharacterized protein n=1 Tax=Psilocybe cyanescens TaxID=93625 RepID=A0A409VME3_PSICY|nr:hypothetical protein CVT25_006009 [Psilocybe cyanescens]
MPNTDVPSKPRTIIRMLSTKFNPRAIAVPSPPAVPSAYSKDSRDAALRARGLLPPLQTSSNRDLSVQEKEHDQHIPVIPSLPPPSPSTDSQSSPADLIKKEWVAKNNSVESSQRHRMNTFKFGGGSSPTDHLPSPESSLPPLALSPSKKSQPLPPTPPTSPSPRDRSHPTFLDHANMFPPPPTSLPSLLPKRQLPTPPQSPPSPESPRSRLTDTPHSLINDRGTGSGAHTPRPSPPAISLTPCQPPIAGSSTPTPTSPSDDILSAAFHLRDDSFAQLEETVSSIMTPSLDSTSQTTTTTDSSSFQTSAGGGSIKSKKLGLGKTNGLQVKTREGASIPVIVESPVDQRFSQDLEVVEEEDGPLPAEMGLLDDGGRLRKKEQDRVALVPLRIPMTAPATVTITPAPKSPTGAVSAAADSATKTRKRGMTDSTATAGARKLLNPFKRDKPLPPSPTTKPADDTQPVDGGTESSANVKADEKTSEHTLRPRRLTMSASLSNLRRSFIGTLSRPSNGAAEGSPTTSSKKFNASHLPPSPTIPAAFAAEASIGSRMHNAGGGGRPSRSGSGDSSNSPERNRATPTPTARIARQPVVIYNRGSILLETANIEDDEVRRMTELAFLG